MQRDDFIEKGARECGARGKLEIARERWGRGPRHDGGGLVALALTPCFLYLRLEQNRAFKYAA
jgi:hypothetical protein